MWNYNSDDERRIFAGEFFSRQNIKTEITFDKEIAYDTT
jgi:hypothetical protein